jgi:hypothetical protein
MESTVTQEKKKKNLKWKTCWCRFNTNGDYDKKQRCKHTPCLNIAKLMTKINYNLHGEPTDAQKEEMIVLLKEVEDLKSQYFM